MNVPSCMLGKRSRNPKKTAKLHNHYFCIFPNLKRGNIDKMFAIFVIWGFAFEDAMYTQNSFVCNIQHMASWCSSNHKDFFYNNCSISMIITN